MIIRNKQGNLISIHPDNYSDDESFFKDWFKKQYGKIDDISIQNKDYIKFYMENKIYIKYNEDTKKV
jgi:hypothetical protein|tara:strand:+ start:234 stop:434 length:201 start_codon:yes stop_codon:yes gene_type:complete